MVKLLRNSKVKKCLGILLILAIYYFLRPILADIFTKTLSDVLALIFIIYFANKKFQTNLFGFFEKLNKFTVKLLFPFYLFPIKLIIYPIYFLFKLLNKVRIAVFRFLKKIITYPFKGVKNFLKSLFIVFLICYFLLTFLISIDYLNKHYGHFNKFFCSLSSNEKLKKSVVRVVGGYSEGSGFFIYENEVMTNFHVIADEPSPKIILPDGSFVTPTKIIGDKAADLAILYIEEKFPDLVLPLPEDILLYEDEPLIAVGYPLGTDLKGKATVVKGSFIDFRSSKKDAIGYTQANISVVPGMSGGPLTDQCGEVIGISTISLGGQSLFINGHEARMAISGFTDQEIEKISVDPSISPEEAVKAFYTYLKARNMKEGFALLSKEYLKKTNYEEWTNRFTDILDVEVIKTEKYEDSEDTAFVKFTTKNWVDGEAEYHYYEGTWKTVKEGGVYKMVSSKILEVEEPGYEWFYE